MSSPADPEFAGLRLLDFISKGLKLGHQGSHIPRSSIPKLLRHERALIDQCFAHRASCDSFDKDYVESVRLVLDDQSWEIVRVLLSYDNVSPSGLLQGEDDLVFLVVQRACLQDDYQTQDWLSDVVQLLINHGAPVNFVDAHGKTALYYTCEYGFEKAFHVLIKAGAEYDTRHEPLPMHDGRAINIFAQEEYSPDVHLLRCTLNHWMRGEHIGPGELKNKWGPILVFLLDHGQSVPNYDRAMTKALHDACYENYVPLIERLIALGVDINGACKRGGFYDHDWSGSALHAATMAAHKDVVRLLVSLDAKVNAVGMHSMITRTREVTAVASALHWHLGDPKEIHETCEILVEAGASDEDGNLLLSHAARENDPTIVRRLLDLGYRLEHLSFERHRRYDRHDVNISVEVVRLLIEHGATSRDPSVLQRYAASRGDVPLLAYLVEVFGKQIDPTDLGIITYQLTNSKGDEKIDMLRYLVEVYGCDVNEPFGGVSTYGSPEGVQMNFLIVAARELNPHAVQLLLELGADVDCPGLDQTALDSVRKLTRTTQDGYIYILPIIRLLILGLVGKDLAERESSVAWKELLKSACTSGANDVNVETIRKLVTEHLPSNTPEGKGQLEKEKKDPLPTEEVDIPVRKATETTRPINASVYSPLKGWKPVRLLRIHPAEDPERPLETAFVHVTLREGSIFDSIAFVPTNAQSTTSLVINESTHQVAEELSAILRKLRLPHDARLIWLDVLCINHYDVEEKSHQVSILKDIYAAAQQHFVFLGGEADDSRLIFDCIADWKSIADTTEAGDRQADTLHEGFRSRWNNPEIEMRIGSAYRKLMRRPWLSSPWMLLQLVNCKKGTAICGDNEEDISMLFNIRRCRIRGSRVPLQDHPCYDAFRQDTERHLNSIDSIVGSKNLGVSNVLTYARYLVAADPRDVIFGMNNLFGRPIIDVDYSLSVQTVYQNFTENLIGRHGLRIVHWTRGMDRSIPNLPSWVPDFSMLHQARGDTLPWNRQYNEPYCIDPSEPRCNQNSMLIEGLHLDTIKALAPAAPAGTKAYSPAFLDTVHGWETLACTLDSATLPPSLPDSFLTLLCSASCNSSLIITSFAAEFSTWYKLYGTGPLFTAHPSWFTELDAIRLWRGPWTDKERGYKLGDDRDAHRAFERGKDEICAGDRMCTTQAGRLGTVKGKEARVGDEVVWMRGGQVAFVVRKEGQSWSIVGECKMAGLDIAEMWEERKGEIREYEIV